MIENKFFDVIFFCGLSALFTSLVWIIIGIVWSMIRKGKWIELGRELEREEPQTFRKTKGTRRAPRLLDTHLTWSPVGDVWKSPKNNGSKVKKVYDTTNPKDVAYLQSKPCNESELVLFGFEHKIIGSKVKEEKK